MKTTHLLIYAIILTFIGAMVSCRKEQVPAIPGHTYHIQPNVFNSGVWQPVDTVYAYYFYTPADGILRCACVGPGAGKINEVKDAHIDSLHGSVNWKLPVDDLK